MNPYGYGPERWPGRRAPWLIPLLIGAGLGALLIVLMNGFSWRGDHGRGDFAASQRVPQAQQWQQAPQAQQPVAPQQQSVPVAPQAQRGFGRGMDGRGMMGGHQRGWFSFLPFGGLRMIVPLLLIAGGAWLLSRPRRGSGGQGPAPAQPATAPPTTPQHGPEQDPPATSETQRL